MSDDEAGQLSDHGLSDHEVGMLAHSLQVEAEALRRLAQALVGATWAAAEKTAEDRRGLADPMAGDLSTVIAALDAHRSAQNLEQATATLAREFCALAETLLRAAATREKMRAGAQAQVH